MLIPLYTVLLCTYQNTAWFTFVLKSTLPSSSIPPLSFLWWDTHDCSGVRSPLVWDLQVCLQEAKADQSRTTWRFLRFAETIAASTESNTHPWDPGRLVCWRSFSDALVFHWICTLISVRFVICLLRSEGSNQTLLSSGETWLLIPSCLLSACPTS